MTKWPAFTNVITDYLTDGSRRGIESNIKSIIFGNCCVSGLQVCFSVMMFSNIPTEIFGHETFFTVKSKIHLSVYFIEWQLVAVFKKSKWVQKD